MKIGFVVNDLSTEHPQYTTTRLAMEANNAGHEVAVMGVGDLGQDADGRVIALAHRPGDKTFRSLETFLNTIQDEGTATDLDIGDLDVLMLRNDPSADAIDRPWAQTSGVLFGQIAAANGVIVVNDPVHLADAINKTYFQHFPEEVRPRTLISRNPDHLKDFIASIDNKAVLKPLQGSGGQGVFFVNGDGESNVNQIIETISRDGYVVAQEYLEAAKEGDVRLFVMNGEPLMQNGEYAAFRRVPGDADERSNMHAGGKAVPAKVDETMLQLVRIVRPKLIKDGMFLVGLDIVGDKLMEVNVFSPGGLGSAGHLAEVNFSTAVIEALEHKVALRAAYGPSVTNVALATL
jgi:glutathione synthase